MSCAVETTAVRTGFKLQRWVSHNDLAHMRRHYRTLIFAAGLNSVLSLGAVIVREMVRPALRSD
jgi:hypothetical protein